MAQLTPAQQAEIVSLFREEAAGLLDQLVQQLMGLEQASPDEAKASRAITARLAHNLKGAASSVGLDDIATVTHAFEQALLAIPPGPLNAAQVTALMAVLDALAEGVTTSMPVAVEALLEALAAIGGARPSRKKQPLSRASAPEPASSPPTQTGKKPQTGTQPSVTRTFQSSESEAQRGWVRLPAALLEELVSPLAALVPLNAMGRQQASELSRVRDELADQARQALRSGDAATARLLRGVGAELDGVSRALVTHSRQAALAVGQLEAAVRRTRLVPLVTLEPQLARAVHEAARSTGREASFELVGADAGLDRRTLEAMKDPLLHLVRNAVAHGLEAPADRVAAGKPRVGRVTLTATATDQSIRLEVRDDGAGIDVEALRERARSRGLLPAERLVSATRQELLSLVWQAGFSTAATVTELSGRGVGLDSVSQAVQALDGAVALHSTPGKGTTFQLTLPLSLVGSRVLLVRRGGRLHAVPASAIESVGRMSAAKRVFLDDRPWLEVGEHRVRLLSVPGAAKGTVYLLLSAGGHRAALEVEEIVGEQDVVIQPLGPPVGNVPGILGATVLADGSLVTVLSPLSLVRPETVLPFSASPTPTPSARSASRVLVVDDSITTRTLETHILESAGYDVRVASDGRQALEVLRGDPVDVVVSDVEMPRLDGVGLALAMREDPQLASIPLILVTSLASEDDRRRGLAAGARAYVVKSRFDQDELLALVRSFLP